MHYTNVLYLGMADDIMSPLLLVPNLTILYVIDKFDSYFSPDSTFDSQKNDIINALSNGSDLDKRSRKIYNDDSVHFLEGKSKIISNIDDGKVWRLQFEYMDKIRNLIYYHHRDFLEEWPNEIMNITHVMTMGSFGWYCFKMQDYDCQILKSMLHSRTSKSFNFYALWFTHDHFSYKITIKCGKERDGTEIGMITIDNKKDTKWIRKLYRPDYVDRSISRKEYFNLYLKQ